LELFQADVLCAHLVGKEYAGMVLKLVCTLGGEIANGALLGAACLHFGMAVEVVAQAAGYIRSLCHHTDSLGDVTTDGGQKNGENLALPLEIQRRGTKAERLGLIDAALADVGLAGCRDKRPDELSGGMRQRAAFARTMLAGSDLLLLDEPFSALDFLTRISMQEWLLDQWQRHKKTILFITHDVEEAVFLSSSVLVVDKTPIHTLREIPVPMDYPRTRQDLTRPEIVALREQLVDMLRKQVTV